MSKVLVVEDSKTSASVIARRITRDLGHSVVIAGSMAEARAVFDRQENFLAALLDLNLPDAAPGECVDLAIAHKVPAIVFTGELSDEMRESIWNRHIVDYIHKDSAESVDYVVQLISRLEKNPRIKILVVDDSRSFRFVMSRLLTTHRYQVLEAASGPEALAVLSEHPDVKLVTVDYHMPGMDGFALTREIRRRFGKDILAVVGVSSVDDSRLSAKFIKGGANDYLNKPFQVEEFYTRITQNLEMLEHMAQMRDMAERDFLTRVYNRRYFFSAGSQVHALLARAGRPMTVAMLDLDHFKSINDSLGHEAGDAVLRQMAAQLAARFRSSDVVARLGGEEFCVLAADMTGEQALEQFEELRLAFVASPVPFDGGEIPYTVSIGLCCAPGLTLDAMLREADSALYRSKAEGRNRVSLAAPAE